MTHDEAFLRDIMASPDDLTFDLWTDGACAGNPGGPGGYAAVSRVTWAHGSGTNR